MLSYARIYAYIREYTRIYKFQTISKSMHICEIRTRNLVHTFHRHYHCTASVNTSVLFFRPGLYTFGCPLSSFASPGGWCRTSGAGSAAPNAPAMTSPALASTCSWPQQPSGILTTWHKRVQTRLYHVCTAYVQCSS